MLDRPNTLGELREAGYRPRSVREEVRENLVAALREGRNPFPGILGYDRTVLPALHIAGMSLSRNEAGGEALTVLNLDTLPSPEVMSELLAVGNVRAAQAIVL